MSELRRDTAPGYLHEILECAPHEVADVLVPMGIARRDLRVVQSLTSLATVQPEWRRAAPLIPRAEELAGRMRRALEVEG